MPASNTRAPKTAISLHSRLKVRNLYLSQALSHEEIAQRTGLRKLQVAKIVFNDRLPAIRRKRLEKIVAAQDARTDSTLQAFNEQLAEEAEEVSLGAIARARAATESGDVSAARDFAAWSNGISSLVKASRAVRGLDARASGSESPSVSVYLVRGESVEKNVTPAPQQLRA